MSSKTAFAVVTAMVLTASYTSVQARTHPRGGVAQATIEPRGALSQARLFPDDPPASANAFPRRCVSSTIEEGARSAFPAWEICNSQR